MRRQLVGSEGGGGGLNQTRPLLTTGRAGQNAQFTGLGQRAGLVHLAEKLCSFSSSIFKDIQASARARGTAGNRQWVRDT